MKIRKGIMLLMLLPVWVVAQQHLPDSTVRALKLASDDSSRYALNHNAALYFQEINKDSSLFYNEKCLSLAENNNLKLTTARVLANKGYLLTGKAKYAEALNSLLQAFAIAENPQNASRRWFTNQKLTPEQSRLFVLALTHHMYGILMKATQNPTQEVFHFRQARRIALLIPDKTRVMLAAMNLGEVYQILNKHDSALVFLNEAKKLALETGQKGYFSVILAGFGDIALKKGDTAKAKSLYYEGISSATATNNKVAAMRLYTILATLYLAEKNRDSSLYFAQKMLQTSVTLGMRSSVTANIGIAYEKLYESYKLRGQLDSAYKYSRLALAENDSINNTRIKNLAQFQSLSLKEQLRLKNLEKQKALYQSRIRIYALLAGLAFFIAMGIVLWRNNRKQKQTNQLLSEQKEEISTQRDHLEHQNHELEIEAALERVRTVAMGLRTTDDLLSICRVLLEELIVLGFSELRNAMINIVNDEEGSFLNYDCNGSNLSVTPFQYNSHPVIKRQVEITRSASDAFIEHILSGDDLADFKAFRVKNGETPDPKLENIAALYYYFYSIGEGSVGISTFSSLPEEKLDVLKRFRNVFDLAYRRYSDIQLAEAQAKEARLETALERVRAVSMAMKKSEEVLGVCQVMYTELYALGFTNIRNAQVAIKSQNKQSYLICVYSPSESITLQEAPFASSPIVKDLFDELEKSKDAFYQREFTGQKFEDWRKWRDSLRPVTDVEADASSLCFYLYSIGIGHLGISTYNPITAEQVEILKRFKKVFELAYTRYTDVAQAEAQAREAQIQLALERVRARSMAMQRSEELAETVFVLFQQFKELGENPDQATIGIVNEEERVIEYWVTMHGQQNNNIYKFSIDEPNVTRIIYDAWKVQKSSLVIDLSGKPLFDFMEYRASMGGAPVNPDERRRIINVALFSKGLINVQSAIERSEESIRLLERFAQVFEQTYTRFLDLQKSEAQGRESQIQLALERVRARTMAMHKSAELTEVAGLLFKQVNDLGIKTWTTGFNVWSDDNNSFVDYITSPQGGFIEPYTVYAPETKLAKEVSDARKNGDEFLVQYAEGEVLKETYLALTKLAKNKQYEKMLEGGFQFPSKQVDHFVFGSKVSLMFITYEPVPEAHNIFKRFGKVFEQTYTRFLDLQKAEAQVREAQIEAALERVRSKTMAMHSSQDVADTSVTMFQELVKLGVESTVRCGVAIISSVNDLEVWTASQTDDGSITLNIGRLAMTAHPLLLHVFNAWKNKESSTTYELTGEAVRSYFQALNNAPGYPFQYPMDTLPEKWGINAFFFHEGCLFAFTGEPLSLEMSQVFIRFAGVFGQTYTRFLDLQKAEAQAREAQIEAALERVRSKTMAMHSSHDIADTVAAMFDELLKLGIKNDVRSGISILNNPEEMEIWTGYSRPGGKVGLNIGALEIASHPMLQRAYDLWAKKESHSTYTLTGEDQKNYYKAINNSKHYHAKFDIGSLPEKTIQNAFYFPEGFIHIFSHEQVSSEEEQIFKRFAGVFGLTYRRFLDLEKAEAQAREARIEAALERVRSCTLAMQKSDELAETAAVLFRQMISLGIEPNRLYIGITKENTSEIEFWITDEDGSKVSNMFTGDAIKNISMKKMHDAWKAHQKSIVIDMHGNELTEYLHYLGEILHVPFKGGLEQKRRVSYISFFSNGFIGMASPGDQPQETINLLDRFAYVFNLTYARFNDLKIAELHAIQAEQDLIAIKAARKNAEDALTDLRAAQKQLIQSEKMASLGELTAGIAHEIQNPLNFVNNFSEVSAELVDELAEGLDKGDIEEVKAIASDIRENLEKIRHHGKRADGIVKGMLQHSRSSSGQKEPTDLNALADEYLRLSYHGLRAKDKSFNADLVTHFDKGLPKIIVIPQDMGRVILNLINNAFYATQQKQKTAGPDYKPTVEVKTQVSNAQALISVKDNGIGIPDSIKDKILQPFFTTKPTGEGTGLGLSLTYDIVVKSHGGNILINSTEGNGSEFIVNLPLKS